MPSHQPNKAKPWVARVKRGGQSTYLGHFSTYDEAWDEEQAYAAIYPAAINKNRQKADPTTPKVRKPFAARRYRGGYITLGYYATAEEARAVEAAFDAANPRKKPGPNPNPVRPARMRNNAH
jgi:hypothetical protein